MKKAQGFTLIELVVVIVILGILAATALPKFVDFTADAEQATAEGIAGGIASSASIQYAANQVNGASYTATAACDGDYLQSANFGDCGATPTSLSGKVCTVTCGSGSSSVTLP